MTISTVTAVIPVLNEEATIGAVVSGLMENGASEVVVVDNGSTDGTVNAPSDLWSESSRSEPSG